MTTQRELLTQIQQQFVRKVVQALLVNEQVRLLPSTIEALHNATSDALLAAKQVGELHPLPRERKDVQEIKLGDMDDTLSATETQPGYKTRPPPRR